MRVWCSSVLVVAILATSVAPVASQTISEKGQVIVGAHEIHMKAGYIYAMSVVAKDFNPRVKMKSVLFYFRSEVEKPYQSSAYYYAAKDQLNTIYVIPDILTLNSKGPFDYTFDVTSIKVATKPVLEVKGALAATDPSFKAAFDERKHHKTHKIKLEAGQFYVIEMTSTDVARRLDTHLYLLDGTGKMVTGDWGGGGSRNSRIVFQPTRTQGSDYTIITAGHGDALGDFTLTVRTTAKE